MTNLTDATNFRVKISVQILRYRWPLAALIGISFIIFEISEHAITTPGSVTLDFIGEIVLLGFIYPLIMGSILTLLAQTESQRIQVVWKRDLEYEFNKQIGQTLDWNELTELLLLFPRKVAPFTGVTLFLQERNQDSWDIAYEWRESKEAISSSPHTLKTAKTCACFETRAWHSLNPDFYPADFAREAFIGYCLPLINGDLPVAMLHLFVSADIVLTDDQIQILNHVAPSMAFAIDRLHPYGSGVIWETATESERRRLARHLHDSLGQNLGYLTLKLDMLKGEDVLHEMAAIRQELAQMHYVANHAYEQVRTALTSLQTVPPVNLLEAIQEHARAVGQQARMDVQVNSQGEIRPLPGRVNHKVLGIVRETLTNVAKHACAQQVQVSLVWNQNDAIISVKDDGVGFDPDNIETSGHYGLKIMKERAGEINGRLTINADPDIGTEVILYLPIPSIS
ncbi:MAG: hypothetical protein GY803_04475 [Chloroflexi bacterium]|nr:hypothetical protein [Chloroflexota bacterium]